MEILNNKSIQTMEKANEVLNQSKEESKVLEEVKNLGTGEEDPVELEIIQAGINAGNSVK